MSLIRFMDNSGAVHSVSGNLQVRGTSDGISISYNDGGDAVQYNAPKVTESQYEKAQRPRLGHQGDTVADVCVTQVRNGLRPEFA